MTRTMPVLLSLIAVLLVGAVFLFGCPPQDGTASTGNGDDVDTTHADDEGHHDDDGDHDDATQFANPESGVCPVSGDAIDPSITVEHEGKTYALCCDDCIEQFNADPESFIGGDSGDGDHDDGHDHGSHD